MSGAHLQVVDDADDPRLDAFRGLPGRESDQVMWAESPTVVARLLASTLSVIGVLGTRTQLTRLTTSGAPDVPRFCVRPEVLRQVVGFSMHRGVVAVAPRPRPMPSLTVAPRTVLVAEALADPANVGAVLRHALAFGVDLVVCDVKGADPYSRRALRASMGAAFTLPIWHTDVAAALNALFAQGPFQQVAAVCDPEATPVNAHAWADKVILFVGHEGFGLSPERLAGVDVRLTIPVAAAADSLNVAAAAAVMLYARRF